MSSHIAHGVDYGVKSAWADEVRALAKERDAVILAHNYQVPEIQEIAHHVGDSLALSRIAAQVDASTIIFCMTATRTPTIYPTGYRAQGDPIW